MGDPKKISEKDYEDLVAYLDEELDVERSGRLESKIANNPSARHEIELLRQTWDYLDYLPMPEPKAGFTERTVQRSGELQNLEKTSVNKPKIESKPTAVKETAGSKSSSGWRWLAGILWLLGLVVCFSIGFIVVRSGPDRNRRLIDDLPVLIRYEEYRAAGDIEFLRLLHEQKTFEKLNESFLLEPQSEQKRLERNERP